MKLFHAGSIALGALLSFAGPVAAQGAAACPVKIGLTLPLTGSLASVAKPTADSANLAAEHVNAGGGVKGCPIQLVVRDDQNQPNVGVDAAKYMAEVERVSLLTGALTSSIVGAILTAVAVPNKLPLVSSCASAETFTKMAEEGRTNGLFFRVYATVRTQAAGGAKAAFDAGYKNVAIIHPTNDLGTGVVTNFTRVFESLGGKVVAAVPFNENQPSYRAEVNQLLAAKPDALVIVAFVQDGATITREWLSLGGTQNLVLHNGVRSKEYVRAVGAKFLEKAIGFDNAAVAGPGTDAFTKAYQSKYNTAPNGPCILPQYDAIIVASLAMNIAPDLSGTSIRDAMRKIQDPKGTVIGTGPTAYAQALALIKEGKPIKYVGATGPVEFDRNGDVTGPTLVWNVRNGELGVAKTYAQQEIAALLQKSAK